MKLNYLFFLPLLIFIISSKSTDSFIIKNLNDAEKSKILTDKGVLIYENEIEKKQEYNEDSINKVKEYFLNALLLDNNNEKAKEYIKKIESEKQNSFNKMTNKVFFYKNKKNKTEKDEFNQCFFLERALDINPTDNNALKLKRELKPLYDNLVSKYLSDGNKIKEMINNTKSENDKISLYVRGYDIYNKIKLIDGTNNSATKEIAYYSNQLAKVTAQKLKENDAKLKSDKFSEVYAALKDMDNYNNKSNRKYTKEILDLKFRLFNLWGMDLYGKGNYQSSLYKINEALAIKYDKNLENIKSVALEKLNTEYIKNSYETTLALIDELIDKENLNQAKVKIDAMLKIVKDASRKSELNEKSKIVIDKSRELYNSAIEDYNNENFSDAIRKFQIVIKIISDYRDVKNYLEKSLEKQKVLDMH